MVVEMDESGTSEMMSVSHNNTEENYNTATRRERASESTIEDISQARCIPYHEYGVSGREMQ